MQTLHLAVLPVVLFACRPTNIPDTAEGTVEYAAARLADYDPGAIWDLLPRTYQEDITRWARQLADRLPGGLYEKSFIALGKLGVLLKSRNDALRGATSRMSAMFGRSTEEDLESVMIALGDINILLANSELATTERLQIADLRQFFDGTGAQILKLASRALRITGNDPIANLRDLRCEVLAGGPQPKLKITVEGTEFDVEFTQFENKWVPTDLVDNWPQVRAQVASLLNANSARLAALAFEEPLDQLIDDLDALLATESREEFVQEFQAAVREYTDEFQALRKLFRDR